MKHAYRCTQFKLRSTMKMLSTCVQCIITSGLSVSSVYHLSVSSRLVSVYHQCIISVYYHVWSRCIISVSSVYHQCIISVSSQCIITSGLSASSRLVLTSNVCTVNIMQAACCANNICARSLHACHVCVCVCTCVCICVCSTSADIQDSLALLSA